MYIKRQLIELESTEKYVKIKEDFAKRTVMVKDSRSFIETFFILMVMFSGNSKAYGRHHVSSPFFHALRHKHYMADSGVQGPLNGFNSLMEITTIGNINHQKWAEPYFDAMTPKNITALVGKSAYLSCKVRNLGNKTNFKSGYYLILSWASTGLANGVARRGTMEFRPVGVPNRIIEGTPVNAQLKNSLHSNSIVSWIRHRDIHILTVGSYTYTSDQRFQATYHRETEDWTLQIKWAQKRDAGIYECQISTQPVRSYFVRLNVVVPTATILGGPDLHVDKGSTINLTCLVKYSPEPPAYIFWYHHDEVINYDSSRGGVSVITEKGDVTTSFLLIQNADLADSGKYSCSPSNADVAAVRVYVLNGEHPEAMQTGSSGCKHRWLYICLLLLFLFWYNLKPNFSTTFGCNQR